MTNFRHRGQLGLSQLGRLGAALRLLPLALRAIAYQLHSASIPLGSAQQIRAAEEGVSSWRGQPGQWDGAGGFNASLAKLLRGAAADSLDEVGVRDLDDLVQEEESTGEREVPEVPAVASAFLRTVADPQHSAALRLLRLLSHQLKGIVDALSMGDMGVIMHGQLEHRLPHSPLVPLVREAAAAAAAAGAGAAAQQFIIIRMDIERHNYVRSTPADVLGPATLVVEVEGIIWRVVFPCLAVVDAPIAHAASTNMNQHRAAVAAATEAIQGYVLAVITQLQQQMQQHHQQSQQQHTQLQLQLQQQLNNQQTMLQQLMVHLARPSW